MGVRIRGITISLAATILAGVVLASPAVARKKPSGAPHQIYLSGELGGPAAGVEGIAPWEEEPVAITSSDLSFSTAAGTVTCTADVAAKIHENRAYNSWPELFAGETSSAPCTSPISPEPTRFTSPGWEVEFAPTGQAPFCTSPFPYAITCQGFRKRAMIISFGSLGCEYQTGRPMNGSFDPAAFGSDSATAVEVTLPAVKFKLVHKGPSSAWEGCPGSGELSAHLQVHTASEGALMARVVESQRRGGPLCSLNAIGDRCTVSYLNPDEVEAREVNQVFMPQENPALEGVLVRVPMAGECQGTAEIGTGTMLAPGASCTLTLERVGNPAHQVKAGEAPFGILTLSLPGRAPAVSESEIQ